ncbi:MAG TPA: helix-hairpin-helix domain-containing protein [Bacillota bacterium]|nr:competence protein ComEA [Candidatus Fermentithermobacillaceae bacterium]HOK64286.1 helix-hairpin-helix domain-containing protein [Bacillota bacterium]HOL11904.1 helix-hairpin-helix domain-containing protein [Bacillota bacterium]HOQ02852.1 helix-hairpin-helix domain-containing protein [Bacillota bacterium]HPP60675.1 helix-hairpin-helix domain-containing protein [Bacillota bacterium]
MERRRDLIVGVVSILLLIGAFSLWWQGVSPSSSGELVLMRDGNPSPGGDNEVGGDDLWGHPGFDGSGGGPGSSDSQDEQNVIFVHVTGAVKSPGVYKLVEGQRVYEVLELAEILDEADIDFLNLAGLLHDQEKIYVPKKGEVQYPAPNAFPSSSSSTGSGTGASGGFAANPVFPININTASAQELEALPGIGPVKAQAIVDYRKQKGQFTRKEDIKKVSGIGDATYSKIESFITVK